MRSSGIPIWFFIGVLLSIYGVMIVGYGLYEWTTGHYAADVQMTSLHTPVWWGGLLTALGLFYVIRFRPGRSGK